METDSITGKVFAVIMALSGFQAYAAIVIVLFACGMGVPIPEDITLFAAGFLAYKGRITLAGAVIVGLIGVLVGDSFMYLIGRNFGRKVFDWPVFRKIFTSERIKMAEEKIQNNARIICFTSRFAPGLRAPVYITSGVLRVPFTVFIGMDGLAALISVPVWVFLAYFLGDKVEMLLEIAKQTKIGVALVLLVLIGFYIVRKIRKRRYTKG
ncbi:MAG: DedA family protein [Deltaproteobacteria bacterium]|nr:DedA family protein [Deltaproteobacteria bacterium]MBT4263661.1 DedA family protein [Deltaproteobacteria bacterium]MBT4642013.1 DedA family protein [Deltaproteobacteria bacterium]MBT6499756.1 DedA family protein [Deltaproteobacteria bacterium]MBT6613442.1 DedA family protein [Deltaproteobacteria bacterium]